MKVIFLDIDGVLNTEVFIRILHSEGLQERIRDEYGHRFDPMAVDMFKWIIEETGAKIVISSTWRMSGLLIMQEMWGKRNLPGEVIGITPNHMRRTGSTLQRGKEIQEWLDCNPVQSYVIIDDDSDMESHQLPYFVQTDFQYGLTYEKAVKCVDILGKK